MARELRPADDACPVELALSVIGSKWTILIVRDLLELGPRRFGELHRSLAECSTKSLSARLRDLEREGIVVRTAFREVPPRVEYSLTPKGQALVRIVEELRAWSVAWLGARPDGGRRRRLRAAQP